MEKIVVVGSGIVGQATGRGFLSKGHEVVFVDVNPDTISRLVREGWQVVHLKEADLTDASFIFVSVSTPTGPSGRIVLDHLISASTAIGKKLGEALTQSSRYRVVVVRSTVPPGTTEGKVIPFLEQNSGGKAGRDFGVAVNPEYLREAQAVKDFAKPWITIIGENDPKTGALLEKLYKPFGSTIYRVPIRLAEFQKYVHNLFNATKISFFNEMRMIAEVLNLDADMVFRLVVKSAEGIWNPKYGIKDLGPYGGSCLPKDVQAFFNYAREDLGIIMPLLAATIEVNEALKRKLIKKSA